MTTQQNKSNYNNYKDKTREEAKELVKDMSFKEKCNHFWYYHKAHTFIMIAVIVVAGIFIHDILTKKDLVLNVVVANAAQGMEIPPVSEQFLEYAEIDSSTNDIMFDTSIYIDPTAMDNSTMSAIQKMSALTMTGELDILIGDTVAIDYYASGSYLADIVSLLPTDLLTKFENDIVYYQITNEDTNTTETLPLAIRINDCPKLKEWNLYFGGDAYFSIIGNASNIDNSINFLRFLYED